MNSTEEMSVSVDHLMPNYGVRQITLVKGKGTKVWDSEGREYLDFLSGISVNNLGHCPDAVVRALTEQAGALMHCTNLYLIPEQARLADRLCSLCFADRAFFCNSGAEANEAAIKLARLYSKNKFGDNRFEIITVRNSFHGRTLATLTATGQEKIQKGFEPLMPGFLHGDFNDLESVVELVSDKTCAIMVEPVQGEGGVTPATQEFLSGLRALCDKRDLVLIFDEIQCGMARCGKLFAHQVYGVEPDIMTLAKALGNGFPIGATLARDEVAEVLQPGTHGSTFGGNPMACAVALAVLDEMEKEDLPSRAAEMGTYFAEKIKIELGSLPIFKEVRGLGLMTGIVLTVPGAQVVKQCMEQGILINCTMTNVLRILPPLVCTREECDRVVRVLYDILRDTEKSEAGL